MAWFSEKQITLNSTKKSIWITGIKNTWKSSHWVLKSDFRLPIFKLSILKILVLNLKNRMGTACIYYTWPFMQWQTTFIISQQFQKHLVTYPCANVVQTINMKSLSVLDGQIFLTVLFYRTDFSVTFWICFLLTELLGSFLKVILSWDNNIFTPAKRPKHRNKIPFHRNKIPFQLSSVSNLLWEKNQMHKIEECSGYM